MKTFSFLSLISLKKQPVFIEQDFFPTAWTKDMLLALRIYLCLKVFIASSALLSIFLNSSDLDKSSNLAVYCWVVIVYSFVQYITTTDKEQPLKDITVLFFALDVAAITLVANTQEFSASTAPILMLICIASASMIMRLRLGIALAIFAIVLTLIEQGIRYFTTGDVNWSATGLVIVGILFTCYFLALLARRAKNLEIDSKKESARSKALIDINDELVQNLDTGVIVIGDNGKVETCNPAAARLFDRQHAFDIHELAQLSPDLEELWKNWIKGEVPDNTILEKAGNESDENESHVDVLFSKLGTKGNFSKITLFTESLLREQAQKYSLERMGRMASAIAHEIRNPLTSMMTAIELLQPSQQNEENVKTISAISRNILRINQIIEDVLAIGHSKQAHLEKFDLGMWTKVFLEDYIESKGNLYNSHIKISNKTNEPILIHFSQSHLKQVLTNLFDNAVNHGASSEEHPIVLSINDESKNAMIEIFSPGEKMSIEDSDRLFEPFYTTKANKGGTGLGLYLCQQICELNLSFISHKRYNNGNGFIITFFSNAQRLTTPQ